MCKGVKVGLAPPFLKVGLAPPFLKVGLAQPFPKVEKIEKVEKMEKYTYNVWRILKNLEDYKGTLKKLVRLRSVLVENELCQEVKTIQ